jgi:peptide/nickel transport system permease protein
MSMHENRPWSRRRRRNEFLYFALRNQKLRIGLTVVLFFLSLASSGRCSPITSRMNTSARLPEPPSSEYWFGTTIFGQDVFTQFVQGLRATFLVGIVGGGLAAGDWHAHGICGRLPRRHGGRSAQHADQHRPGDPNAGSAADYCRLPRSARRPGGERCFIGLTAWPWAASAIRAQTFSLRRGSSWTWQS